ncbi:hypothetical protein BP6252_00778 [Coleophoma cylindrospora]|uniref:Uncharacterized protein n=1 Tax=Coleophoma cylindrospora TaxID=1849047 RepID=A0A3D8SR14_9HELO|nr:hypothetical protein BP6252_00778 [Coleophoma cylindrospora]
MCDNGDGDAAETGGRRGRVEASHGSWIGRRVQRAKRMPCFLLGKEQGETAPEKRWSDDSMRMNDGERRDGDLGFAAGRFWQRGLPIEHFHYFIPAPRSRAFPGQWRAAGRESDDARRRRHQHHEARSGGRSISHIAGVLMVWLPSHPTPSPTHPLLCRRSFPHNLEMDAVAVTSIPCGQPLCLLPATKSISSRPRRAWECRSCEKLDRSSSQNQGHDVQQAAGNTHRGLPKLGRLVEQIWVSHQGTLGPVVRSSGRAVPYVGAVVIATRVAGAEMVAGPAASARYSSTTCGPRGQLGSSRRRPSSSGNLGRIGAKRTGSKAVMPLMNRMATSAPARTCRKGLVVSPYELTGFKDEMMRR